MPVKGKNNADVRIENRKRVTEYLFSHGNKTKSELSKELYISLPTIHTLVAQLEDLDLIKRESTNYSTGGRIPDYLSINENAYFAIGMEIAGNQVRLLIQNLVGKVIDRQIIEMAFSNTNEHWTKINAHINAIIDKNNIKKERVMGVGIAVPGPVKNDLIKLAPTLNLTDFHYKTLDKILDLPFLVENEANSAGFAEVKLQGNIKNAVYLSITNGVGGALIQNNNIVNGINGHCGAFGHMTLFPFGLECSCGKHGCFEAYCSTKTLSSKTEGNLEYFFQRLSDDYELQKIWESYLDNLALGISNILVALDLPLILGGHIVKDLEKDLPRLERKVNELIPFKREQPFLSLSRVGSDAAAIGGALLISAKYLDSLLMKP